MSATFKESDLGPWNDVDTVRRPLGMELKKLRTTGRYRVPADLFFLGESRMWYLMSRIREVSVRHAPENFRMKKIPPWVVSIVSVSGSPGKQMAAMKEPT